MLVPAFAASKQAPQPTVIALRSRYSPRGGQSIPTTVYIGPQTGLPPRLITTVPLTITNQGTKQETTSTADFCDYGAKITIVLPNY